MKRKQKENKKKKPNYKQGRYIPEHPEKWKGNINDIIFRSGWEYKCCRYFDNNPNIIAVSSEEFPLYNENGTYTIVRGIPYWNPVKERMARYFVDFWIKYKNSNGVIIEALIEVKPFKQTMPPKMTKTKTGRTTKKREQRFLQEQITYMVNCAKWETAKKFAKQNNMIFIIITEKDLFGKLF